MKKIFYGLATLGFVAGGMIVSSLNGGEISQASANPDYICKKAVSGYPCEITRCDPWRVGVRTCYGTRATHVGYYLVRTSCEAGYSQIGLGGNSGASSGRQGGDYVTDKTSCSIEQYDTVAPSGNING